MLIQHKNTNCLVTIDILTPHRSHHNTYHPHHTRSHFFSSNFGCVLNIHNKLMISFGDESGECASETAATSKEDSMRANCPILTEEGLCGVFLSASLCCASAPERLAIMLRGGWSASPWARSERLRVCLQKRPPSTPR